MSRNNSNETAAFGAPHLRYRLFLVAHASSFGRRGGNNGDEGEWWGPLQVAGPCAEDKSGVLAYAPERQDLIGRPGSLGEEAEGGEGCNAALGNGCEDVSNATGPRCTPGESRKSRKIRDEARGAEFCRRDIDVQDAMCQGWRRPGAIFAGEADRAGAYGQPTRSDWWLSEPDVLRVVDGLSQKLDGGEINAGQRLGSKPQRIDEEILRKVWGDFGPGLASQRWETDDQFTGEFADALLSLSHEMALGERERTLEITQSFMYRLRETCEAAGALRNPSQPFIKTWITLSQEDQDWCLMATCRGGWVGEWPGVPRVATGVKDRVSRLKCLGNGVVPQVAEWIGRRIMEAEND